MLGYYLFLVFKRIQINQELAEYISKNQIKESELVVFKIPILIYHYPDREMHHAKGEFEYKGNYYDIVKQNISKDTLYTYCYNNPQKAKLHKNLSKHSKEHIVNHEQTNSSNKAKKVIKPYLKDYIASTKKINLTIFPQTNEVAYPTLAIKYSSVDVQISSPPPKQA